MEDTIIVVVGPTASGKSETAVKIAKKIHGQIISCDSRQIYQGMDIGTGKVEGSWKKGVFVYKNIPHYCIDFADPKKQFSASLFQTAAQKALAEVREKKYIPILCGGTGQWIDAVIKKQQLPEVKPNPKLRKQLEQKTVEELFVELQRLDPDRAAVIDWHNKRRLVRALEIVITTGKPVPKLLSTPYPNSQILWIGLYPGQDELYKKIDERLELRLKQGMITEVQKLHTKGLSWKKLEDFGLEYKFISLYLQKKIPREDMKTQLAFAIKHYAKRQMTWFRKNPDIIWIPDDAQALSIVSKFLKK